MIEVLPAEDENIEEKMNELKEEVEETKNIFKLLLFCLPKLVSYIV